MKGGQGRKGIQKETHRQTDPRGDRQVRDRSCCCSSTSFIYLFVLSIDCALITCLVTGGALVEEGGACRAERCAAVVVVLCQNLFVFCVFFLTRKANALPDAPLYSTEYGTRP